MAFAPLTWVVVPIVLIFFQRKKMYLEMLLGFFVILILSDNRQYSMRFAADIKDVYLLLLTFFMLVDRQAFAPTQRVYLRFLPFILTALVFLPLSDVVIKSAQKTLSYFLLFVVVPNYLVVAWRMEGASTLRKLIWTGVTVLILGLALRFLLPGFVSLAGRYTGLLGNPNGLGLFCTMFFIVVVVARDVVSKLFTRPEMYFIYGVIFISILLSGSRNAVFTVVVFMVFNYLYRISPFLGIFAFLIAILVYQLLLANLGTIIIALDLQEYFRIETLESASGRLIAWEFGWDKISENPMIGHGIGYTDNLYRVNYDFLSVQGHQGNAHNSYITFWLDTGLLGLVFYLFGFIRSFVIGSRKFAASIPALFAILFSAFFESWLTASLNPFTIQCVIIITIISTPVFLEVSDNVDQNSEEDTTDKLSNHPEASRYGI